MIIKAFKTRRRIKAIIKRNIELEYALRTLWEAKKEKDKSGKTERYQFYKVAGWDLTKQVLRGKV